MALYLRRAARTIPTRQLGLWKEHLAVVSGVSVVGTMMRHVGGTLGDCWFWSITCVLTDDTR